MRGRGPGFCCQGDYGINIRIPRRKLAHKWVHTSCLLRFRKTAFTSLFQSVHWLPIQQRIQYKINALCDRCITRTVPWHLCDCVQPYTRCRILPSLLLILSASRFLVPDFLLLVPVPFCLRPLYMVWPFPPTDTTSGLLQSNLKMWMQGRGGIMRYAMHY